MKESEFRRGPEPLGSLWLRNTTCVFNKEFESQQCSLSKMLPLYSTIENNLTSMKYSFRKLVSILVLRAWSKRVNLQGLFFFSLPRPQGYEWIAFPPTCLVSFNEYLSVQFCPKTEKKMRKKIYYPIIKDGTLFFPVFQAHFPPSLPSLSISTVRDRWHKFIGSKFLTGTPVERKFP